MPQPRREREERVLFLEQLPGLAAELEVDGFPPVKGTLVDVRDGRVIVSVRSAVQAAVLSASPTVLLTVDGPAGVRFQTTANPVGTPEDREISLAVGPTTAHARTA